MSSIEGKYSVFFITSQIKRLWISLRKMCIFGNFYSPGWNNCQIDLFWNIKEHFYWHSPQHSHGLCLSTMLRRWYHFFPFNKTVIGPIKSTSITRLSLEIYSLFGWSLVRLFNHRSLFFLPNTIAFLGHIINFKLFYEKKCRVSLPWQVCSIYTNLSWIITIPRKNLRKKTKLVNFSSSSFTTLNNHQFFSSVLCLHVPPPNCSVAQKETTRWENKCIHLFLRCRLTFSLGFFINEAIIIFIYARSNKTVPRSKTKRELHHAMKYFWVSFVWRKFGRKVVGFISTLGPKHRKHIVVNFFPAKHTIIFLPGNFLCWWSYNEEKLRGMSKS